MHYAFRDTGFQQQAHGLGGDQRGLLGRLGQHWVTGSQSSRNLTAEDCQREVPRADADHWAQWAVGIVAEIVACLYGVVAQEVDCLTNFGDGVGKGLASFTGEQTHQRLDLGFHQVCGALEDGCTLGGRGGLPDRCCVEGALDSVVDVGNGSFLYMADHVTVIGRVEYRRCYFIAGSATEHRRGFPVVMGSG
ncbi:hypothetical protein D3C81_1362510 [compost metagenome]